jgi:hypothetical protein
MRRGDRESPEGYVDLLSERGNLDEGTHGPGTLSGGSTSAEYRRDNTKRASARIE